MTVRWVDAVVTVVVVAVGVAAVIAGLITPRASS